MMEEAPPVDLRKRRIITGGLLLAMAVVALETTVVVTALPSIVGELDRLDLYPWVFSAYLLTSTVGMPLCGKLADTFGRRRVFLIGMTFFLGGSIMCGLARDMTGLILWRAVQGVGAAAVMPSILTVVSDLYRLRERAQVQGAFSSLWGIASLFGPGLGAWLTLNWSWRAVFFIGVPFGLAAGVFFLAFYREDVKRRKVSLDIGGSLLLMGALTTLLLAMTQGSEGIGWASPLVLALLASSLLMFVGFVIVERRAPDPVLPLSLFKMRVIWVSSAATFLSGMVLYGVTSYVPLYVQGALGEGAAGAGLVLTPMLTTWAVAGYVGQKVLIRFGFRAAALNATALLAIGAAGLLAVSFGAPRPILFIAMVCFGFGFGQSSSAFMIMVQEAVPANQRGVATSASQLFRSLGGTVGVALLGTILHVGLTARVLAAGLDPSTTSSVLRASGSADVAAEGLHTALAGALQPVFVVTFLMAAVTLLVIALFARAERQLTDGSDT